MGTGMYLRLILAISLTSGTINVRAEQLDEYHVKAAFLYNFAKFVDWPAEAFPTPGQPFAICVFGEDPFGRSLDDVITGRAIDGRLVIVRRISDARQTGGCQILFVTSKARKSVVSIFAASKHPGVLTVGETGNSTSEGLIINFTLEGGKVRFEINLVAATEEKLRFNSRLLNLATVVRR
jgi:YfiR/HmsC-like